MNVDILVNPLSTPLLIGIYKDSKLLKSYEKEGKTSDVLPLVFEEILKEYSIKNIYYVNGPGSYMSIKVSYLFLKTLAIVYEVKLKAIDGFALNNNSPIKALGKKYFFKEQNGKIKIDFLDSNDKIEIFKLPENLQNEQFLEDCLPSYNLPAI